MGLSRNDERGRVFNSWGEGRGGETDSSPSKTIVLQSQNITRLYFANSKVKQFSKRFDWNNIFTAILTKGGIGKGIADTGKGIKKNDIYDM